MSFARLNLRSGVLPLLAVMGLAVSPRMQGAGVTLITHGNSSDTYSWVAGMANALSTRLGGSVPIYRITINASLGASVSKVTGGNPAVAPSGHVIVMLDWGVVSANSTTTYDVAQAVAPLFGQTNLIAGLEGHALAELPIHLIGHSRGGSLVCELSRLLGEQGLWVDQVTCLDAYPLSTDASALTYENVLFADCYHQTAHILIDGLIVPGTFRRKLTQVSGGYDGLFLNGHSDVHVWYHGTIDLSPTASNGDGIAITSSMRDTWWTAVEAKGTNAGHIYTPAGGGDRLSSLQPNGNDSSPIRDGFNRYYEIGGGAGSLNRSPVMQNTGDWPNPIRFDLVSTNTVHPGETISLATYFQWAQPGTSTQTVHVLADPDKNPLNGNEYLIDEGFASGTTAAQVGYGIIDAQIDGAQIPAGDYNLLLQLATENRRRFLYAPQTLQLLTPDQPLLLEISQLTESQVILGINSAVGRQIVLEASLDASAWMPLATNLMESSRWELVADIDQSTSLVLFRAVEVNP